MLSRFHLIPERNGQTDGRTDRFAIAISRVSMLSRDKNLRLVWINSGLIKIVNIYGKLTYPGPEVDQECYVIMMI